MSEADRLADYFARIADPTYTRTLADGHCCNNSRAACRASWYIDGEPCCDTCSH